MSEIIKGRRRGGKADPHVAEGTTESDSDTTGTAAESRGGTIESSVTSTEDDDMAKELRELGVAAAHAGLAGLGDEGQVALGRVEAVLLGEALEGARDGGRAETKTEEDSLVSLVLEGLDGKVPSELLAALDLDAEILHQLHLKVDDVVGQTEAWDLTAAQTSNVRLLLEDRDVLVAQTSQESGATDARRSASNKGDLLTVLCCVCFFVFFSIVNHPRRSVFLFFCVRV